LVTHNRSNLVVSPSLLYYKGIHKVALLEKIPPNSMSLSMKRNQNIQYKRRSAKIPQLASPYSKISDPFFSPVAYYLHTTITYKFGTSQQLSGKTGVRAKI
jgi:hypothetical protein